MVSGHRMDWKQSWSPVQLLLSDMHFAARAAATGSARLPSRLRKLARYEEMLAISPRVDRDLARGKDVFAVAVARLSRVVPRKPIDPQDEDALVRALWWQ